jgi:asparagine synthase (glutamine-hydrolysing)
MERLCFWELPVDREEHFDDERAYEEQLKVLFREAVEVRLAKQGPTCSELSGGLDSSSIVCMGTKIVSEAAGCDAGSPALVTFSYTHESSTDERYFQALERSLNLSGIHLPLSRFPLTALNQMGQAVPSWWEPRFRELARQMAVLGSNVLLTGQFGDLIMGNTVDDSDQVADFLRNANFVRAAREAFSWSQALRVPIYSILWRALRANCTSSTAPIVANSVCDQYGKMDSLAPEFRKRVALSDYDREQESRWQAAPPGRRRRFRAVSEMLAARMLQVPETLQHVSYAHPYAHRPLVEFMLTIPPSQVCRPGEPRRLMRRAFAEFLPTYVVRRKSKGAYHGAYRQALLPLAAALLKQPGQMRLVEFRYVDQKSFVERLTRFIEGLECNEYQLRQLILFEFWLRGGGGPGDLVADEAALSWIT